MGLDSVRGVEDEKQVEVALWRLAVLGPLMSARLNHGDIRAYLAEASERVHRLPDGRETRLSRRTIEAWHYAYQRGGFEALKPKERSDQGQSRVIRAELAELLLRAKAERPRRSIRPLIKMMERAGKATRGELTKSSVHRLLRTANLSFRPARAEVQECRAFITEFASDLWVGDSMHGPLVVLPSGKVGKCYLLTQLDCATRSALHSYFAASEGAVAQEYGFKQAVRRYGPPRAYYVDRGPAYGAHSLRLICAELGTRLLHTASGDCQAKGSIERWHRTMRDELLDELDDEPLPLGDLNSKLWAYLNVEYHAREHDTTKRAPREHLLSQAEHLRPIASDKNLDEVFLHRESRKVRNDGTVRYQGKLLEVRPELMGQKVELRFDPTEPDSLPKVYAQHRFVCDTVMLDRFANNTRERRRIRLPIPSLEPTGIKPLEQMETEHYQLGRPCVPAAENTEHDE